MLEKIPSKQVGKRPAVMQCTSLWKSTDSVLHNGMLLSKPHSHDLADYHQASIHTMLVWVYTLKNQGSRRTLSQGHQ